MRTPLPILALMVAGLLAGGPAAAAAAEVEVEHYQGKEAKTLAQAVANLREYNDRLAALVDKDELTAAEMEQVHQLTYTLENALQRINSEMADIAADLETVHQASERREPDVLRQHGRAYLQRTNTLVR